MNIPPILNASVKVMRSHDYCHFEVILGTGPFDGETISCKEVDLLRKEAARLADRAVEQYKIAKATLEAKERGERYSDGFYAKRAADIAAKAESERTPDDKATLKEYQDACFQASRQYDYQDDWQEDQRGDDDTEF